MSRLVLHFPSGGNQVPAKAILDSSMLPIKDSSGAYILGS